MKPLETLSDYAGAMGPGFLLVHDNAQPHVARVCRKFLEEEGIDIMLALSLIQQDTSGTLCLGLMLPGCTSDFTRSSVMP